MEPSKYQEEKKLWQEISLWLRFWKIPYRVYDNLPSHLKIVLHNCICMPVKLTTDRQRSDLLRMLFSSGIVAGRESVDLVEDISAEYKERLLSPLTEKEKQDFLSKF